MSVAPSGEQYEIHSGDYRATIVEVGRRPAHVEGRWAAAAIALRVHGSTRWANWRLVGHEPSRVTLSHRLHPQPGWSGILDLTVTHELDDNGLTAAVTAHNRGPDAVPFGAGAHPYLVAGDGPVDDWILELEADTVTHTDDRGLPTERIPHRRRPARPRSR